MLRIPLYGELGSPDPALASSPASTFLSSLLYSGLVKFGPDLHIIPELAVSIPTISTDGRTYTFTVRQDARFADGHHCTAYDVAFSLTRALSPGVDSPLAGEYLGEIKGAAVLENGFTKHLSGVTVLDRLTVRIRLVKPDADFLQKLAFPVASVVDHRAVSAFSSGLWVGHASGTGPWVVTGRERNGGLELSPRPHFYGSSLEVRSLLLLPVSNQARAIDLYRKGDLDVAQVPNDQFRALSHRSDFHDSPALDAYYALPQASHGTALAATLDRDRLLRELSPALSPLDAIVPPAVPDYVASSPTIDTGSSAGAATADPDVTLQTSQRGDWGITMLEQSLLKQWTAGRRWPVAVRLIHAASPLPDPAVWLSLVWSRTPSQWFHDLMVHSAGLTNDPVSRMSAYSKGENWALKKGLIIPLAGGNLAYLIKPAVNGLQVTPLGLMPENNNWPSVSLE